MRIGAVLKGKWTIDALLGRGGVGTVYAATHRNGSRVAIKMLNSEVARDENIRARFLGEGYVANTVNHPGVVRVLDDDVTDDGKPFLVMELLTGEHAEARRARQGGRLPLSEVLRIGDRVLDVLAAAHDKRIIHRDIKPENIFLCTEGSVRVLDFGIARMRMEAREATMAGTLLGTPEFMSPEQANGVPQDIDFLTDIWATGATIFTLLSGEYVHAAATMGSLLITAATTPARSLSRAARDVPAQIIQAVDRALMFDKRARWPSAREMQRALTRAREAIAAIPTPAAAGPPSATPTSSERTILDPPPPSGHLEATRVRPSGASEPPTVRPPAMQTAPRPAPRAAPRAHLEDEPPTALRASPLRQQAREERLDLAATLPANAQLPPKLFADDPPIERTELMPRAEPPPRHGHPPPEFTARMPIQTAAAQAMPSPPHAPPPGAAPLVRRNLNPTMPDARNRARRRSSTLAFVLLFVAVGALIASVTFFVLRMQ